MKARVQFLIIAVAVGPFVAMNPALGQGNAFTYQGRLADGGAPANGAYDLQFTLYDAPSNPGNIVAAPLTNSATAISNGLFTVMLDFGSGVFTGAARWLEIGVRTNGGAAFATLSPRQQITPSPYAILAGDVALGNTNVARLNVPNTATTATGVPVINNGFVVAANVTSSGSGYITAPAVSVIDTTGSGALITSTISNGAVVSMTVHNAGSGYSTNASLMIGAPPSNAYQAFVSTNFFSGVNYLTNANNVFAGNGAGLTNLNAWQLNGNGGTVAGPNFVGTVDNQPLELRVNAQRALRLEPTTNISAVNVIGGSSVNGVDPGVVGATIAGGGTTNYNGTASPNHIGGSYSTIGGGGSNSIAAGSTYATIAGGGGNAIQIGLSGTIGGGVFNILRDTDCVIGGGFQNTIEAGSPRSVIGGGLQNTILTNTSFSVIGGGYQNQVQDGESSGGGSGGIVADTISGGQSSSILSNSYNSSIGGGYINTIGPNAPLSTISGGGPNSIQGSLQGTICGGNLNTIQAHGDGSAIGGGTGNTVLSGASGAVIAGGYGHNNAAIDAAIGGGTQNLIQTNSRESSIGGGFLNTVQSNSPYSTIAGGSSNSIQTNAPGSFISSGTGNTIQGGSYNGSIGGGQSNIVQTAAPDSTIAGGFGNVVGAYAGSVGGGLGNTIQTNASGGSIAGGNVNIIQTNATGGTIGGGQFNIIQSLATNSSTIGGGFSNTVNAAFATVPGGFQNAAVGEYSFAAGNRAKANHAGAFVWADSQAADFSSLHADIFQVRCRGGVEFTSGNGGIDQAVAWSPGSAAWSFSSDRNLKDRIAPIDAQSVLDRVSRLPLSEWSYIGYQQRHIGPMAQDFHALFPLNDNERMLNELDVQGVALAAIQGLNQKLEEKNVKISALEKRLAELEAIVASLAQNRQK